MLIQIWYFCKEIKKRQKTHFLDLQILPFFCISFNFLFFAFYKNIKKKEKYQIGILRIVMFCKCLSCFRLVLMITIINPKQILTNKSKKKWNAKSLASRGTPLWKQWWGSQYLARAKMFFFSTSVSLHHVSLIFFLLNFIFLMRLTEISTSQILMFFCIARAK